MAKRIGLLFSNVSNYFHHAKEFIFGIDFKEMAAYYFSEAKSFISDIKLKLKDLRNTNFSLGVYHYGNGNLADARFRFRFYSLFWHDRPETNYYIGRTYLEQGNLAKALPYLEKYLGLGHTGYMEEASYSLNVVKGNTANINNIPLSVLRHKYDSMAKKYGMSHLHRQESLPQHMLCNAISLYFIELGRPFGNKALDLGCGLGVIGRMLSESKLTGLITGIDISLEMLQHCGSLKANGLPIYCQLLNIDAHSFLEQLQEGKYDLVVASDILASIYDVQKLISVCGNVCSDSAVLAILYRVHGGEGECMFDASCEVFLHSPISVGAALKANDWKIIKEGEVKFIDGTEGVFMLCRR